MGGDVPKQYMDLCGEPLLTHSLRALAASGDVTDIVIVIPAGDEAYVTDEIVAKVPEAQEKIRGFAHGGKERYNSVLNGLRVIDWACDLVLIHDGARPFIDAVSIKRLVKTAADCGTAIAGMPSKDTVKIADENSFAVQTPNRNLVWIIQTPQVFRFALIRDAYEEMDLRMDELVAAGVNITDDAMVLEHMKGVRTRLVEASYRNIKVTTPEDLPVAEAFLMQQKQ